MRSHLLTETDEGDRKELSRDGGIDRRKGLKIRK